MSELKLVSPLLDGFVMGDPVSDRNGVRCCPAMRENSDEKYIVKIISVPASQKQLDALLLTGAYPNAAAAAEYFKELAEDTVKEARLLQQLAKLEGFLSYEGWQIVPMEGEEVGYDVYLLGSYKRSLEKYLRRNAMTHLSAVNLGIDLCAALSLCRRGGFIYTALTPANVFMTSKQEFRIGDLGFAKLSAMKYSSLPRKAVSRYTPPELHDPYATLNPTVDTYAVGMILYQIYNNGELPFAVKAPMRMLHAPLNADYEMAEIILKACDPNPRKRYQTPIEMGQALVSYMQRNSINDVPIVPPTVENVPVAPATEPGNDLTQVEPTVEVAADATPAPSEELRFMEGLVSDDTAPGADESDNQVDAQTSDEVDQILSQADEIISQESDIISITEEPEDVALPEEVIETSEEAEQIEEEIPAAEAVEESSEPEAMVDSEEVPSEPIEETDHTEEDDAIEDDDEDEDDVDDLDLSVLDDIINDEDALEFGLPESVPTVATDEDDHFGEVSTPKKKRGWIGLVIALLVLALVAGGGYYYFTNLYTLHIDDMAIDGYQNTLTVQLSTTAKDNQLTVVCTDTYGNKQELPVSGGKVSFTNLAPDTMYKLTVEAEGFHRTSGSISGTYTTSSQTNIVDFTAKVGMEDGSVILNFTVDGPEAQEWIIEYTAEGEETQSVTFTGHMVTIHDLTIGKDYSFTLAAPASSELYLAGTTSLNFKATNVLLAQNLTILSCENGVLKAQWTAPSSAVVENWTVRCYSDAGYDETVVVTDTNVEFSNVNTENAYTLEVTAAGMSQSVNAFVTANSASVTNVQVTHDPEIGFTVTWDSAAAPAGGWLVLFRVDGSETTEMAVVSGNTATVKNVIPNASYSFQIMAADGSTVFGGNAEHQGIEPFDFDHYGLTAAKIQSSLCRTPDKEAWTHEDVGKNDYTTSFAAGERASLVLYAGSTFYLKTEDISVTFVIRNADGQVIPSFTRTVTKVWRDLWPGIGKYCYLDIPVMPTAEGKYTVEVYFNGATALTKNFSIITTNG